MPRFDKLHNNELIDYLYNSCIHDAKFTSIRYDSKGGSLAIETINPIFNIRITFTFHDVEIALVIRGHEFGNQETIVSLTTEEDFSYLHNYYPEYDENKENFLYLLFQTFSGDEIHIVSREVEIETEK